MRKIFDCRIINVFNVFNVLNVLNNYESVRELFNPEDVSLFTKVIKMKIINEVENLFRTLLEFKQIFTQIFTASVT